VLSVILKNHIDLFEAKFGEIKLPIGEADITNPEEQTEAQGKPESKS
jgi:hypothetical protein